MLSEQCLSCKNATIITNPEDGTINYVIGAYCNHVDVKRYIHKIIGNCKYFVVKDKKIEDK